MFNTRPVTTSKPTVARWQAPCPCGALAWWTAERDSKTVTIVCTACEPKPINDGTVT